MHACIHTYIHMCMHECMHTHIHTHTQTKRTHTHIRPSKIKMQNLFTHFRGKVAVKSLKSTVKKPKSLVNNKNPQQKYRLYDHFIQM